MTGVKKHNRADITIQVTTLERTLVDVLDRPDIAGSWEEIWRSLESVEYFDMDQILEYVTLLENATTSAKVVFFLEQHREQLMISEDHLRPLRAQLPRQPHYLMRGRRRNCRWIKNWNLMIPEEVLNKTWGAVL